MGVASVARSNASNCKREGKGNPSRVTIGTEADFSSNETLETTQQGIVSRFPRSPDAQGGLARVDVACPFHTEAAVFFVPAMDARSTDKPIKSRPDRFRGGNGFNEYPNLNHVTRFPVVAGGFETGGDDNPLGILVEDESVHREPFSIRIERARE
jgi:hypothetical protein